MKEKTTKDFRHINVCFNSKNGRLRQLSSNDKFFSDAEYCSVNENDGYYVINKHRLDVPKKASKLHACKYNWFSFTLVNEMEIGVYEIDEQESCEDYLVIYHKSDS
jgi:hypothetical protein